MKTIIALIALTFFNCTYAQFRVSIQPDNASPMELSCETRAECDQEILKWQEKQKVFLGDWTDEPSGSLISKEELDLEGNSVTKYLHPQNYSASIEDITQELADKKDKKDKDAQDLAAIKAKILDGSAKLDDVILYIKIKEGM